MREFIGGPLDGLVEDAREASILEGCPQTRILPWKDPIYILVDDTVYKLHQGDYDTFYRVDDPEEEFHALLAIAEAGEIC